MRESFKYSRKQEPVIPEKSYKGTIKSCYTSDVCFLLYLILTPTPTQ